MSIDKHKEHAVWMPEIQKVPLFEKVKAKLSRYFLMKNIKEILKSREKISCLDVGCGYKGNNLNFIDEDLKNINHSLSGIDFKLDTEYFNSKKYIPLEGNALDIMPTLDKESFDVITFFSVFEHLDKHQRDDVAKQVKELLTKEGFVYINSPTWFGKFILENVVLRFLDSDKKYKEQVDTHKTYFSKSSIWQLLIDAGFVSSEVKIGYSNFFCSVTAVAKKNK